MAISKQLKPAANTIYVGGLADTQHKLVLPQGTTSTLAQINPQDPGSLAWDTTQDKVVVSDGSAFAPVSTGDGPPTGDDNTVAYFGQTGTLTDNVNFTFNDSLSSFTMGRVVSGGTISASGSGSVAMGNIAFTGGLISATNAGSMAWGNSKSANGINSDGVGSTAFGNTQGTAIITASGAGSLAFGTNTSGAGNILSDSNGSFAHGFVGNRGEIHAGSNGAVAFGESNGNLSLIASTGIGSLAFGNANAGSISSTGNGALAHGSTFGTGNIGASGTASYARSFASSTTLSASGSVSTAIGISHTVSADLATAFGLGHNVSSYASLVIGRNATVSGTPTSWVTTDPAFVIADTSSKFQVNKDGTLFINDPSLSSASNGYVWTLSDQTTGQGGWAAGGITNPLSNNMSINWLDTSSVSTPTIMLDKNNDFLFGNMDPTLAFPYQVVGAFVYITNDSALNSSNISINSTGTHVTGSEVDLVGNFICLFGDEDELGGIQPQLRFFDATQNNHLAIQTIPTLTATTVWNLPDGNGTAGQVLTTDGANPAALSWSTPSGGGSGAQVLATRIITGTDTLSATTDYQVLLNDTTSGSWTLTLPTAPPNGQTYQVSANNSTDTGSWTLTAGAGDTLDPINSFINPISAGEQLSIVYITSTKTWYSI